MTRKKLKKQQIINFFSNLAIFQTLTSDNRGKNLQITNFVHKMKSFDYPWFSFCVQNLEYQDRE